MSHDDDIDLDELTGLDPEDDRASDAEQRAAKTAARILVFLIVAFYISYLAIAIWVTAIIQPNPSSGIRIAVTCAAWLWPHAIFIGMLAAGSIGQRISDRKRERS